MVAHNNPITSVHLRKKWQFHVKTWFDQPAKKQARRVAREAKAKRVHPRPVNALRPVVRSQTVKYNTKVRLGRGFSIAELKAAGIKPVEARGIGIAVDHRRNNRSEESVAQNVERLKAYTSKLVVFPRKAKGKDVAAQLEGVAQVTKKNVLALPTKAAAEAPRKATPAELEASNKGVVNTLRQALMNQKLLGKRQVKYTRQLADRAAADKKKAKADAQ